MTTQAEKYHISMAGEYFVAAQLQRLFISASITYGNAKGADVVAFNNDTGKAVIIEVKTSSASLWPVGSRAPDPGSKPWVFVHLPKSEILSPEFYVVTQTQLHNELAPDEAAYMARYKAKHGVEYGDKPGVSAVKRRAILKYKDCWATIIQQIEA